MTLNAQFAFDSSSFNKFTELWYHRQLFYLLVFPFKFHTLYAMTCSCFLPCCPFILISPTETFLSDNPSSYIKIFLCVTQ